MYGDDVVAAFAVDDFKEGFGHSVALRFDEERLRHGDAGFGRRFQATFLGEIDDAHVGKERMIGEALWRFQQDALLDAGAQGARKDALERIAGIDDETGVDVAPVGFEIGVHSGEGAWHRCGLG
ncbi:MAG TPA: hypothetical protein VMS17_17305 [Gemmataceae bacterium]|nr:hypothetical protein [Gemmataceae bacterium]